ncbi:MAG: tRNA glutamyl-Q(34) synthetase GluQRS [Polymorphobacter sp.]|uniref:tRNA glutamyl-Q(34) synthetase GluQRS n=1 Tax=Polymorphobacter sp. TaxID=1909290 RepID=UPI003A8BDBC1
MVRTRFAPSPTGRLHLGHVRSAWEGWRLARAAGGQWLMRMEDIDEGRCRPAFEAGIFEDLAWLGLDWDEPVVRQSARRDSYRDALARLRDMGLIYPCVCTRADIAAAVSAPHFGRMGPEGPLYPGTCRGRGVPEGGGLDGAAWRLDAARAAAMLGDLRFEDARAGEVLVEPGLLGDFVVARRDAGVAYHLAVVVDDAHQQVSDVVRGEDLLPACHGQRLLQAALGLPAVRYHHHPLLLGPDGKRLAKRDHSMTVADMRARGLSAAEVLAAAGAAV